MAIAAASSAARSAFRSSSFRSAATRLGSQAKAARCPFRLPSRNPLSHRIFRCPAEMSACMGSMQPYHSATASALMTSMLTVSRCGYGWLPEGKLKFGSYIPKEVKKENGNSNAIDPKGWGTMAVILTHISSDTCRALLCCCVPSFISAANDDV